MTQKGQGKNCLTTTGTLIPILAMCAEPLLQMSLKLYTKQCSILCLNVVPFGDKHKGEYNTCKELWSFA